MFRSSLFIGGCLLVFSLRPSLGAEPTVPPTQVLTIDLGAAAARDLEESRRTVTRQSDTMAGFSLIQRWAIGGGPLYIAGGVRGESFNMHNSPGFRIRQLQDYGALFSVEYFIGAVRAAYVTIRPGFYFENHAVLESWDVPVEAATGIPITSSLNGVLGLSYARFLHHPVPIAGLAWIPTPKWRLEAIYPNPTVAYAIQENLEAQLTGELLGGGFLSDAEPVRSTVQYYVYRVGANLAWKMRPGFKITGGAGMEYERVFDFWRAGQSFRATHAPYVRLGFELSR